MAVLRFPFRIVTFPDALHLTRIVDEVQLKHPIGHGIIDLRLVLYAEDGKDPFLSDAFGHIPVLHQRCAAAFLRDPEKGGFLDILLLQFLRRCRIIRQQRPVKELGKIFVVCLEQQRGDRVLFRTLSGDLSAAS